MTARLALGLMSGTSADGVSAVAARFDKAGGKPSFELIAHSHVDYSPVIVERLRQRSALTAADVSRLNVEIAEVFAAAANKVKKRAHLTNDQILCIGSHGQTIYHGPRDTPANTLQVGDPAIISERTGLTVVSNFRQRDVAVGGQGAPLIPFFDQYFFGQDKPRALLNIGGISNITVVGKGIDAPLAFDTGPGNSLMDRAVRRLTNGTESWDHNGQRAKRGTIDPLLAARMIDHPYFRMAPPKSTGPEVFGDEFLETHAGALLAARPDDALATLCYLTALSIQEAFRSFVFGRHSVEEVIASGGGTHNKTLMKKLECLFAPIPVVSIERYGVPTQAKEPLAFAFFGLRCMENKINHLPGATGAAAARVLGSVTRGAHG